MMIARRLSLLLIVGLGVGCSTPPASHDAGTGTDAGSGCTAASQCDDMNPCTTDTCTAGGCVFTPAMDGTPTPGVTQVMGNCHSYVCQSGMDTNAVDDTNLPAKVNDCQDPVCTNGAPSQSFANHPSDSMCGTYMTNQPGFCDGMGHCDQCTKAAECPGTADDCELPVCMTGACSFSYTASGTPTTTDPAQVVGDCQTIECTGDGGTVMVADDTDIPVFTPPSVCKTGECTNGVPSVTINTGTSCGGSASNPELCDSTGACGCQGNSDCTSPETCGGGGTPLVCGCTPLTSAACATQAPPVTCGTIPDGCGGMVDCNDGRQDGSETGVDCGGGVTAQGSCTVPCAQGVTCKASADCHSGLSCADGVCCNTACNGQCQACSNALTGTANGTCANVIAGTRDPTQTCAIQTPAAGCGTDGNCTATGACEKYGATTTCITASCAAGAQTTQGNCDGNGNCTGSTMANCTPFICGADACVTSCPSEDATGDMSCASGFHCDSAGQCVQCAEDSQCPGTTTDCQHPQCANNACTVAFTAAGTPTVTSPTQIVGDCRKIECDGSGGTTMAPDNTNVPPSTSPCVAGACSNGSPMQTPVPGGTTCTNGAGVTTVCNSSGFCGCQSDSDCNTNQRCGGGGTPNVCGCTPLTPAACLMQSPPATCGTIPDGCGGTVNCNDGKQDGSETGVDCGGGVTAGGSCTVACAQGVTCDVNEDCESGVCADGVCCNQMCSGACEACTTAKKGQGQNGVCGAVEAGLSDPHGQCSSQPASTCGDEGGLCNGAGACLTWPAGTTCQAASCSGNTLIKAEMCSDGTCTAASPSTQNCAPYKCSGSTCASTCTVNSDCSSGYYCSSSNTCQLLLTQGSACANSSQCTSGFCVDGFCCNSACGSQCQACASALTGSANGTCTNVTTGTTDPSGVCATQAAATCGTDGKCGAGGACQDYPVGTACSVVTSCSGSMLTSDTQCNGSGSCSQGAQISPCPNNFACNGTACATSCTANVQCASGFICSGGNCVP